MISPHATVSLFILPIITFICTGFCCAPPGFIANQDPAFVSARCSDLVLYPVTAVDPRDQYRFDYADASFGSTHSQGSLVTITCTTEGQPATVEGYDSDKSAIMASPSLVATCTNLAGAYTWTILGRPLQYLDCRF